jgi:hypothetical protein
VRRELGHEDSWLRNAPMPAGMVPPLGPVLMALLLVKLFCPRLPHDFWLRQGMGLLQVALACVLASGPLLGVLLAAYLTSGLACLATHHLAAGMRAAGRAWEERWRARRLLPRVLLWTAAVGAVALVLFLATPRLADTPWQPWFRFGSQDKPQALALTGFSEEINLHREGWLAVDSSPAFTVQVVHSDGTPRTDVALQPDQRWRGSVLDSYADGRLATDRSIQQRLMFDAPRPPFPDLGPSQYFLKFTVRPQDAGGLFLADPVRFAPGNWRLPVLTLDPARRRRPLFRERFGAGLADLDIDAKREYRYRQSVLPGDDMRWPAPHIDNGYLVALLQQPVPQLEEWTIGVLRRLENSPNMLAAGSLPPPSLSGSERGFYLAPEQWEPVARALTSFLARGGGYSHSYERHWQDRGLDPAYDFLINVRKGPCEHFATALMLMLRSVGIPARVAKGYVGAESRGDGTYLVRRSHAHSWVEVLIPAPQRGAEDYDFLTLDPTPKVDDSQPFSLAQWWQQSQESGRQMWQSLIVEYNADLQADLMVRLKAVALRLGLVLAGVVALSAGVLVWRRRRRRTARPRRGADSFYGKLLALLARHARLEPQAGQTPREFADTAGAALRGREATAVLADLPAAVAELFYRVRFGGRPLSEAEHTAVDARLEALAAALR